MSSNPNNESPVSPALPAVSPSQNSAVSSAKSSGKVAAVAQVAAKSAGSAVNARNLTVIIVCVLLCVACDQATKVAATENLLGAPSQSFLGDFFRLTYVENRGAFLGLGNDWPDPVRWLVFNAGAFIIVGACSFWIVATLRRDARLSLSVWALVLIGAGGLGNLIDRLMRDGAVIDFMNMGIGWLRTGIFNVADVHIMVGLGLLLIPRKEAAEESDVSEEKSLQDAASPDA